MYFVFCHQPSLVLKFIISYILKQKECIHTYVYDSCTYMGMHMYTQMCICVNIYDSHGEISITLPMKVIFFSSPKQHPHIFMIWLILPYDHSFLTMIYVAILSFVPVKGFKTSPPALLFFLYSELCETLQYLTNLMLVSAIHQRIIVTDCRCVDISVYIPFTVYNHG